MLVKVKDARGQCCIEVYPFVGTGDTPLYPDIRIVNGCAKFLGHTMDKETIAAEIQRARQTIDTLGTVLAVLDAEEKGRSDAQDE